jgi:hypothetical protein
LARQDELGTRAQLLQIEGLDEDSAGTDLPGLTACILVLEPREQEHWRVPLQIVDAGEQTESRTSRKDSVRNDQTGTKARVPIEDRVRDVSDQVVAISDGDNLEVRLRKGRHHA